MFTDETPVPTPRTTGTRPKAAANLWRGSLGHLPTNTEIIETNKEFPMTKIRNLATPSRTTEATQRDGVPATRKRCGVLATAAAAVWTGALISVSHGQVTWTVINLHPSGATESRAYGVQDGQQVGLTITAGVDRAALWSGTAASHVNIAPGFATHSLAGGAAAGRQSGSVYNGRWLASLWSGTAVSFTTLNPAGAESSFCGGMDVAQQVGRATMPGGTEHAGFWLGTAASWVDLNPSGANSSAAYGVSNGQQVVSATFGAIVRAGLWNGSAASWVSLHPAGATSSEAYSVDNGQQVGRVIVGGSNRASLWSGTAGSWVDLTPVGAGSAIARKVVGGYQVGYAVYTGIGERAELWHGTAASHVNLHALLPAGYSDSQAWGIWHQGPATFIVGYAVNVTTGNEEAIMWVADCLRRLCQADINCSGTLSVQDIFDFLAAYFAADPRADFNASGTISVQDIFDFLAAYFAGCG